ncbi:MAG: hypothetical protein JWR28_1073 [Modestobacter sp.]|nr:hypothetical protein [Modestobacter sp.]
MTTAAAAAPEPGAAREERAPDERERPDAPQPGERARRSGIPPPYRAAVVVIALSLVMGAAFAASYILALGRPLPRDVPVGVVAPPAATAPVVDALQEAAGGGLDRHPYPSLPAAEAAVAEQQIYAIVDEGQQPPVVYVSSASGASVARAIEQLVQGLPRSLAVRLVDLHPLPRSDPQGLSAFYVTIAATILGFVTVFQLRANAGGIGLRPWLVIIAVLAVAAGAVLAAVSGPLLGALDGPYGELWLILGLQTAIAASFNSAMIVVVGRWAMLPTWTVFIVLGNPSSGGAVAPPLLPAFFAAVGRVLPTGATVSALHTAAYFTSHQHAEPFVVLAAWLVATAVALLVAARVRGRSPAQ